MSKWEWSQEVCKEVFFKKYALHNENDPDQVFRGIAAEISSVEKSDVQAHWEDKFYTAISSGKLIPAGRIIANARPESPMKNYNNCFTIDIEDDMEGIYESLKEDALISKMGGGVGFDISKLRPKGEKLSGGGESSGVISFLRIFDQSAKTIMTGGQRRSAHIALLDISHPEIEDFITVKKGDRNKELTQFNISVKITDDFIHAVKNDADWDLSYKGKVYRTVKARYLYDLLAKNAFIHNEPGIFNADTIERFNNGSWAFKMDRVNPCGELVMPAYSLCCLSAINLLHFVEKPFTEEAHFNFEAFKDTVATAIRFLDNVLDATAYPLKKIEDFSKQWRRIGLGFTGLADTLVMLRQKYGSSESLETCDKIAKALRDYSYLASSELAAEKGSFPAFEADKFLAANFVKTLPQDIRDSIQTKGMRNIQLNTVAPTGTTSLTLGQNCSSGIEPIFSISYKRNIRTGNGDETVQEEVYDYAYLKYRELTGNDDIPEYFVTTMDIDAYDSIDVQAVFQKYIDHSISKTLNLPPGTSFEEYKDLFMYAYDKGLKGFTTFNPEGSMKGVLEYKTETVKRRFAPERPKDLPADLYKAKKGSMNYIIMVGTLNGSLYEIFVIDDPNNEIDLTNHKRGIVRKSEKGRYDLILKNGHENVLLEDFTNKYDSTDSSLARFISMALRHGTPLQFVVSQLNKDTNFQDVERVISRILKSYIKDGEEVVTSDGSCPECGETLSYRDGCMSCFNCGYSKCS